MSEQHSPGPWTACGSERGGCKCGLVWSKPEDRAVATVHLKDESGECSEATFFANMELIASAPALRSRLRDAEALLRRRHGMECPTYDDATGTCVGCEVSEYFSALTSPTDLGGPTPCKPWCGSAVPPHEHFEPAFIAEAGGYRRRYCSTACRDAREPRTSPDAGTPPPSTKGP